MRCFLALLLVSAVGVAVGQKSSPPPKPKPVIKRALVIFGDSLSDNGNYFATYGNNTVPLAEVTLVNATKPTRLYWKGRFTNSPGNWNDKITKQIQKLVISNFAFGGATICDKNYTPSAFINSIPAVQEQVKAYLNKLKTDPKYKKAMSDRYRIAVIWAGANDIARTFTYAPANATSLPASFAECLRNATKLLLDNGHKVVAVGSVPPIDLAPLVARLGPVVQSLVKSVVFACNTAIKEVVQELQAKYKSRKVLYWENNAALAAAVNNYKALGFKHNNTELCLTVPPNYEPLTGSLPTGVCKKPAEYLFWDLLHPTSASHDLIMDSMTRLLTANEIITKDDLVPAKPPPKGLRRMLY